MIYTLIALFSAMGFTYSPDWSEDATLPSTGHRENIYKLEPEVLKVMEEKGKLHALHYPVTVTGILVPYRPLKNFLNSDSNNPLKRLVMKAAKKVVGFGNIDEMFNWLGLTPYPHEDAKGIYRIPYPGGKRPDYPMGVTLMETKDGVGMTFSCATCHSGTLFGKAVLGLTNKKTRANRFFVAGKKYSKFVEKNIFKLSTGATDGEVKMMMRAKEALKSVGAKAPTHLGLDTSLPQVALSLSRRNSDDYATKSRFFQRFPKKNKLERFISESKPAVWWNLKYKTRWLSDGSIVQGNPILTNFLWNEIGRGTDLKELEKWMLDNKKTIQELTVAAFSTKAPKWSDFFDPQRIDIKRAKNGQRVYRNQCMECHGDYKKAWEGPYKDMLPHKNLIETVKVEYPEQTEVHDMGTDPNRYLGMREFADQLNELAISKWMKTVVIPQEGYVPPPLVGIWARWPYLHNNSIPNLCALLTRADKRPKNFYMGDAIDPQTDFDEECVGYPLGDNVPEQWKNKEQLFDTTKPGMSNQGHQKAFIGEDGEELLTVQEKKDLIMFLKTL